MDELRSGAVDFSCASKDEPGHSSSSLPCRYGRTWLYFAAVLSDLCIRKLYFLIHSLTAVGVRGAQQFYTS